MARPSLYSEAMAISICEQLALGMSLREVCRQDEMPALSSVMLWLSKEDWFSEQYARAKAAGVEALAEEMLDIADNAANDWMERNDKDGENAGWAFNGEAAQRSRIRIDTRKWLLSKLAPKKYGDKVEQTVKGDPDAPIEHKVTHTFSQDAADLLSKVRGATG